MMMCAHLVQNGACAVVHLVELVDAAYSTVTHDKRAALEDQLLGLGVFGHVRRQTDRRGAFEGGARSD